MTMYKRSLTYTFTYFLSVYPSTVNTLVIYIALMLLMFTNCTLTTKEANKDNFESWLYPNKITLKIN